MKTIVKDLSLDYSYNIQKATLKRNFKFGPVLFLKGKAVVMIKEYRKNGKDKCHVDIPGISKRFTVDRDLILLDHP